MIRIVFEGPLGGEEVLANRLRTVGFRTYYEPVPAHRDVIYSDVRVTIHVLGDPPLRNVRRAISGLLDGRPDYRVEVQRSPTHA